MKRFHDSAQFPIIAVDFDDTININGADTYPVCGDVRPYCKSVFKFMNELGIKIVIWTSRDMAYNQEEKKTYDHLTPMLEWLADNEICYDAINKSIQFAPYAYNGRKVYAHMYVDDRSFGWYGADDGNDKIMLDVLKEFLYTVCGFSKSLASMARCKAKLGESPTQYMIDGVKSWKDRSDLLGPE